MLVLPSGLLRAILGHLSPLGIEPLRPGLEASAVDDEDPVSGLDRYVGGAYREAISATRDPKGEVVILSDPKRPLEERLESIEAAGRVLEGLPENSHEFFDGVMALFEAGTDPGTGGRPAYEIRKRAAFVLNRVLSRIPTGEDRLRVLVHAYMRFVEAARGDILAEERYRNDLTYCAAQIKYRLDEVKKYCSGVVEAGLNDIGDELAICCHHGPDARFKAPWTLKKAARNAKIGALAGGAFFSSFAAWAMIFSFFWPAASTFLLTTGAAIMTGTTVGSFFYKAPQRLRGKLVTWVLRNDRPGAKELEERRIRLLKP